MAMPQPTPQASSDPSSTGVTVRSVSVGLFFVAFINLWVTYSETVVHASRLNLSVFQLTLLATFVVLVAVINPLLSRIRASAALTEPELITVVAIAIVGAVVPASGVTGFLIGVISTPLYFASPENGWAEFYHPNLPSWAVPTDPEAIRSFYEGLPTGRSIPWEAWLAPIGWWATLVIAVFTVSATAMVILHRQWAQHENLSYPLVAVPIELVRSGGPSSVPQFMRSRLFWYCAIPAFGLLAWNTLTWLYPLIPSIDIFPHAGKFRFTRYSPHVYLEPLNLFTIGFAYFAETQVLFSIWFFFVIHIIEGALFNRLGFKIQASTDSFSADPPSEAFQCFGALACLVVWRLWVARDHLRRVFSSAFTGKQAPEEKDEVLSYRSATFALLASLIYIVFWLSRAGMDLVTIALMITGAGILYLGIARIVSETGVVYAGGTVTPQAFAMDLRGTFDVSPASLTAVALSYSLIDYMRGLFTPGVAQSIRLGDFVGGRRRPLLFCAAIGILVGLAVSVGYTLYLGYTHGAYNFPRFPFFSGDPKGVFGSTIKRMRTPRLPDYERLAFFGIGMIVMGVLTFLRYRFAWWPLHPIGLTLSAADNTAHLVMPVFVAWAAKSILLRLGGVTVYEKAKPAFLGLLVGYTAGVVWSFIVDAIWFPGRGHLVHYW